MLTIVILNPYEEFIQFLDPSLCELTETNTTEGLKSINLTYAFQDAAEDQKLFQHGNKIWVQGDKNLSDCLYVINTEVEQSVFKDNTFTLEAEEVLVELNHAPLVSHLEFSRNLFKTDVVRDQLTVRVDWNSLNYWFGDYFNLGIIQDCLSSYASYVPFTGTMTRMSLLRHIEEQTGNVFVTRYEKDQLDNTIHRYLDFLNPVNVNKNWTLNLEYTFMGEMKSEIYDDNGNVVPDDKPWDVKRFLNSHIEPESMDEIVQPYDPDIDEALNVYDELDTDYVWDSEDELVEDESLIKHYTKYSDIIASNLVFRIVDNNLEQYKIDGTPASWSAADVDFDEADSGDWIITLSQVGDILGLCVNETSFGVAPSGIYSDYEDKYVDAIKNDTLNPVPLDESLVLPDDCYFEIFDSEYNRVLFRTCINKQIGHVHSEVLDFGFNLENIIYDVEETNTYTSVSPVMSLNSSNDTTALTRTDLTDLITRYNNLKITKGQTIPMIIERISIKRATLELAKIALGSYTPGSGANQSSSSGNWWRRPYHPQDQFNEISSSENTWEFLRATAYWKAPYEKNPGLMVESDKVSDTQYSNIIGRNDTRSDKGPLHSPKNGTTETSDEDIYAIYNQVALYLKDHETPTINMEVDVANLKGHEYNNYNIHDKIYIKLPDRNELITARIVETHKDANNISKNSIKVSNYTPVNNSRTELQETIINADNVSFKYPNSKRLTVQLENLNYNAEPDVRTHYPANKMLAFTLYTVENGQNTFKKSYTKLTDASGKASINMKYDPGNYIIEIRFSGDEEYIESTVSIHINVSGKKVVKETKKKTKKTTKKAKTTKKTTKTVTKTTYYDKYGRSPDKKKILAIGMKSAGRDQGKYGEFYGQEFKNYCPHCGKASLAWGIFYAGNETSNYGVFPATGNKEGGSAEGHIFCTNQRCDADYSCQGYEHISGGKKLTTTKTRFKSSKSDAYKLRKGKYVYGKKTVKVKTKKVTNNKTRKVIGSPSKKVRQTALNIVGNKTGYSAMRAICTWMDKNIRYGPGANGYSGFVRSPDKVLSSRLGNCCDQTRLILQLFDSAGLSEYYDMYYVNLSCPKYGHVYARIRSKKTKKWVNVDPASDTYGCYGYVCDSCSRTSPVDSKYPKRPF